MSKDSETPPPGGQLLVYQTQDGKLKIDVRFECETVWLTQQHMAELFQTTKQNIGQHLKSIFAEGELVQDSVVKDSFTTAADGKNYATRFYNLDAITSVGYRVKSAVAWMKRRGIRDWITIHVNRCAIAIYALSASVCWTTRRTDHQSDFMANSSAFCPSLNHEASNPSDNSTARH